ncbi:hypothetical protein JCM17136A_22200 [Phocaeicola sartorii JCM 17136 = DSM 21941]
MNMLKLNTFKFTPILNFKIPGTKSSITITAAKEYPLLIGKNMTSAKSIRIITLKISIYKA